MAQLREALPQLLPLPEEALHPSPGSGGSLSTKEIKQLQVITWP
jgi:hypothetical protein